MRCGTNQSSDWQIVGRPPDWKTPRREPGVRQPRLVAPTLRTGETPDAIPSDGLPDDLARQTASRLRIAAAVWGLLWLLLGLVNNRLVAPWLQLQPTAVIGWTRVADALAILCVALAAGVFYYAPRAARSAAALVNVGIAFELVLAFAIGVINQWEPKVLVGRLSWISVLVVMHPVIVPAPPLKTLIASLLAASMDPVGLLIAKARGLTLPDLELLVWAYLPNYVCAGLALVPAAVIRRLGRQITHARRMGSYQLGELIDRGGMGEVWRARHRLLARPAAIKLIRPELLRGLDSEAEAATVGRFLREAEAAASLRSPHTIQLYDFGVTQEHQVYLVMELLDGLDLEGLVRHFGPQPPGRVVHILCQACHSLAEAHERGLVHRDIKPANIQLCRLGLEYDFVKVMDFGLVKQATASAGTQTLQTAPDAVTGTPAYMAPEMASGDPLDGRVDLYSLGCVGYYLLTGSVVFPADTALQMILMHIRADPVPPSVRLGATIPERLERTILACLAKDPAERPASAPALAQALSACGCAGWSQADARVWWESNLASATASPTASGPSSTTVGLAL